MPTLPSQRNYQYAYQYAYQLACDELARLDDIEGQCCKSSAHLRIECSQKVVTLKYLGQLYQVNLPDGGVSLSESAEPVSLPDKLLILHYFLRARGTPLTGELVTYKELPDGFNYFPTFYKRAIKPLLNSFIKHPQHLLRAAKKLAGRKADFGDIAVTIDAFHRVPITLVLWQGDSEFPPEGSILFDSTIPDYLATEDITVLCQTIVFRLASLVS